LYGKTVTDSPNNISTTVLTPRSIVVTWDTFPSSYGVTEYLISYTTTASYASGGIITVNDSNGTLVNLEEYTNYTITVQAISNNILSDNSTEVSVTTYSDGK